MTLLLSLDGRAARVSGEAPERPALLRPVPANGGHGDVRKKIVPVVKQPTEPTATTWEGGALVSLSQWLEAPQAGGAILLQPADDARKLAGRLEGVALVAVDFHRIGDGRGYTHAFFLRERLGYTGPLRAIGAVTADQAYALTRVGFDQLALRADQNADAAVAGVETFSLPYQSTTHFAGALRSRDAANFEARIVLLQRALRQIADRHERPAFATSLSVEDMVILDVIARLRLPIDVFTLETGRLHAETVALIDEAETRYGVEIARYRPDTASVAAYVTAYGENGFYDGVTQRKQCCNVRKVAPLARAVEGRDAWLTGQRREQANTRGALPEAERDAERGLSKYNPLADWSWADVLAYAARFAIPMNALYARGYVSIGCEPCTKAVRPGEDPRAGRWWWENQESRECGLHTNSTTTR